MKYFIKTLILALAISFSITESYSSVSSDVDIFRKKIRYVKHTVNAGEDIYEILNRYGVKYSDLKDDNETLDLFNLQAGTTIQINKKEVRSANSVEIDADFKKYSSANKPTVCESKESDEDKDKYIFHNVKKGDTIYSLGRHYRVSVADIKAENRDVIIDGILKEGTVVRIPNAKWKIAQSNNLTSDSDKIFMSKVFRKYGVDTPANISLMMPFKNSDNSEITQFVEFYQGFKLGLETMKSKGMSVNLNVYNTERTTEKAMEVVKDNDLNLSDLIVGPVYGDQFRDVAEWASLRNIPIVSPLASVDYDNNGIFQIAPSDDLKYKKIEQYLQSKNIIFVKSIDDDEEFVNKVKELAGKTDYLEIEFNPKQQPIEISDTLVTSEMNLFIVASKKGDLTDAILSKLSSVKTFAYNKQIEVLCSSHIARTQQVNTANMFRLNVSYLTTYHVNRTDENVMDFDNSYISLYGEVPSLYAYRGYDIAIIFLKAMKEYGSDFVKFMNNYRQKSLSVEYGFKKTPYGGYINDTWTFVTYTPNYKILVR